MWPQGQDQTKGVVVRPFAKTLERLKALFA